jgi:hypothetical protein
VSQFVQLGRPGAPYRYRGAPPAAWLQQPWSKTRGLSSDVGQVGWGRARQVSDGRGWRSARGGQAGQLTEDRSDRELQPAGTERRIAAALIRR